MNITKTDEYLEDDNGNRSYFTYFGSEEKALEALKSLIECRNCNNCVNCSYSHACYDCSNLSNCADCFSCVDCVDCYYVYDGNKYSGRSCILNNGTIISAPAPKIDNIHQEVYYAITQKGALDMRDWHTCETTHCRAGWVVHLAGDAGYKLEKQTSTLFAAMQIYKASGYQINPARFFDSKESALEDMRKLASNF